MSGQAAPNFRPHRVPHTVGPAILCVSAPLRAQPPRNAPSLPVHRTRISQSRQAAESSSPPSRTACTDTRPFKTLPSTDSTHPEPAPGPHTHQRRPIPEVHPTMPCHVPPNVTVHRAMVRSTSAHSPSEPRAPPRGPAPQRDNHHYPANPSRPDPRHKRKAEVDPTMTSATRKFTPPCQAKPPRTSAHVASPALATRPLRRTPRDDYIQMHLWSLAHTISLFVHLPAPSGLPLRLKNTCSEPSGDFLMS